MSADRKYCLPYAALPDLPGLPALPAPLAMWRSMQTIKIQEFFPGFVIIPLCGVATYSVAVAYSVAAAAVIASADQ